MYKGITMCRQLARAQVQVADLALPHVHKEGVDNAWNAEEAGEDESNEHFHVTSIGD
eukprot:NODE_9605_length_258_cov_8.421053_g8864_i0.p2 GENE.NODE_9605_length_258_cov_8.421053_g8864_i0~~NODE_9605_length_258_cov_8.421053_g8864_i0.p2  ORF type:complete len:57 (-),score=7.80 NODE_9605_length_258_cov_8.421053_g8864_i0:38-208(-)